ncbi:HpcH/HpaI aldolase/citrate lyase family protein [Acuticoccus sediminis]|nr:aldolase/citrate lyase family protein [Acuticoccus sediminis]
MWPLRTMLFIPAHKLDWAKKVDRFAPDSVVIDIEDALPRSMKVEGRAMAREMIAVLKEKGVPAFVRVNALSDIGMDDVPEIVTDGLAGIMLPKSDSVEEIRTLDRLISYGEGKAGMPFGSVAILPLPETARGMVATREMAAASDRCRGVIGLMGGPIIGDFARAAGFLPTMEGSEQFYLASKMILDSRAGGAPYPMASLIGTGLDDLDGVRMLAERAKRFGFVGAVLIHPSHVKVAAEVFVPTREEAQYFAGMIDAMAAAEARGDSAVRYEGTMVDYAMLPHAHDIVDEATRRGILPATAAGEAA